MEKKKYDIGEEFQVGLSRMKCVAQRTDKMGDCEGCFFFPFDDCTDINLDIVGACSMGERDDLQDVIFVKL